MSQAQEEIEDGQKPATREFVALKLGGLRSEMRLMFVVAIAGNTLIQHLSVTPVAGVIGSTAAVGLVVAIKALIVRS